MRNKAPAGLLPLIVLARLAMSSMVGQSQNSREQNICTVGGRNRLLMSSSMAAITTVQTIQAVHALLETKLSKLLTNNGSNTLVVLVAIQIRVHSTTIATIIMA